jgi:hypothetical protein
MASTELSRRVEKVVGYPPLSELSDLQRVVPEHTGASRIGTDERGEHADRRGLAGAVGTEHP